MDLRDRNTSSEQPNMCKALELLNAVDAAQQCRTRLMEVSLKVRTESMLVNAEFDAIEDAPHA